MVIFLKKRGLDFQKLREFLNPLLCLSKYLKAARWRILKEIISHKVYFYLIKSYNGLFKCLEVRKSLI